MKTASELATEYCSTTTFTDETGSDEALIHNMRFMAYVAGYAAAAPKWISVNTPPEKSGFYCVIPGLIGLTRRIAWCTGYYDSESKIWTPEAMFWIELPPTLQGTE